ncbi:Archaeal phage integrase [uncultured archaeon]|nr:Archaeal phage integrase [uncultured archaeon]
MNPRSADYESAALPLPMSINNKEYSTEEFQKILKLHNLSDKTIKIYMRCYKLFTDSNLSVNDYILNNKNKRNNIAMLKILYTNLNIKFPKRHFKPKLLPNKEQLRTFYNALPEQYKPMFLTLAESGLRIGELLDADIDKTNKMIIPKSHNGQTKHSWVSFYVTEFDSIPKITVDGLNHVFLKTSKKCGIKINPHLLRSVFAREMALKGVQPQYVDAFCGRTPQSVLARHYSDFSPEVLKEIYEKAGIKILS